MRLLIVEDEKDLLYALQKGLQQESYAVDIASDGTIASELLAANTYDLLVLDINLPQLDGYELLRSLREYNNTIKVIIVSANREIEDRIKGLDLGANDYLVKPFDFSELKARIRALLRREFSSKPMLIKEGNLEVDLKANKITYNEKEIPLTRKEYAIFKYLIENKGRVISSEELLEHVWDDSADPFSSSVRVHIYSLRKKINNLGDNKLKIETVKGVGYIYEG